MSDLISRQAAIDSLLKVGDWYVGRGNDEAGRGVAQCQRVIYELPSAERPKGKWLPYNIKDCLYYCSNCNALPTNRTKFCPNCGAEMEREAVGYVPPIKKTNADRIRNMSDEKLASLFGSTCDCDNGCCFIRNKGVSCMNGCEAAWLEWLKKEVEDG